MKKSGAEINQEVQALALNIAAQFAQLPEVRAVTLGGSHATGKADASSDLDLYVFTTKEIPVELRAAIINPRASHAELENRFWETEDYWLEKTDGRKVEVIYRGAWLEEHLENLLEHHQAQLGYTTSLWHNISSAVILYDREDWFATLQRRVQIPYPPELAQAIIAKNFPLLKGSMSAYPKQLYLDLTRGDVVAIHHRIEALLASYFDILFALNHELHPGEKRLLRYAEQLPLQPEKMSQDVRALLTERNLEQLMAATENLIKRLDSLLKTHGYVQSESS